MQTTTVQIQSITAADLLENLRKIYREEAAATYDEAEIVGRYFPYVKQKEAAAIIGCSPSTLRQICLDHPEMLHPELKGENAGMYDVKKVFAIKKIGWKNLRT